LAVVVIEFGVRRREEKELKNRDDNIPFVDSREDERGTLSRVK
jgi:hypothetical protein